MPIAFHYDLCYFVLMAMSNVREIHLIGQRVVADMANLPTQVEGLIKEHDAVSVPLMPGELYFHPVNDPTFPEGTHLLISVDAAGNDATCRRFVIDKLAPRVVTEVPEEAGQEVSAPPKEVNPVNMSLSEGGPVYFLSQRGTLDRIVYRRT